MSNSNLMPLLNVATKSFFAEDESFLVKYLQGSPRQYRANMSNATINLNGTTVITQPKDDFRFSPFAYRYFEDALFGKEQKFWVEFFFLNEALQVCSIMFHQYTAEAFKQHFADYLFYDDLTPCECTFTMRFEEKTADIQEGDKKVSKKYYIGSWKSTPIIHETKEAFRTLIDCLPPVYREDTFKEFAKKSVSEENYKKPLSSTAREIAEKAEWRRQDILLEELSKPMPSEQKELDRGVNNMLNQSKRR